MVRGDVGIPLCSGSVGHATILIKRGVLLSKTSLT